MHYILRNDASSMYIVYMDALMAGFRVNFFLTWVIMGVPEKMDSCGKKECMRVNDRDCSVIYVISPFSLKLWLRW
jgi:hypothetical protein